MSALDQYNELAAGDADPGSPVERLRAYCSLAMSGQDWLDVEPFFDAVTDECDRLRAAVEALEWRVRKYRDLMAEAGADAEAEWLGEALRLADAAMGNETERAA